MKPPVNYINPGEARTVNYWEMSSEITISWYSIVKTRKILTCIALLNFDFCQGKVTKKWQT